MMHREQTYRNDAGSIARLLEVMVSLRDPDTGCPWDRKQNFHTIAPYTIEEAYEVAEAISRDDMAALVDELGDLLFQVVFHAQMASEAGAFDFDDVVQAIVDKMIRRHPHVFAEARTGDRGAQAASWEAHKAAEREARGEDPSADSLMDHVPARLPAVKRAQKIQKRAARAGFDWAGAGDVLPKIHEELEELRQAMAGGAEPPRLSEEVGDLIFSCINLARHLGVDAEMALRGTNTKFERRFRHMESALARRGLTTSDADPETLEALWAQSKRDAL